ncbi:uncharacterized protein [Trachinotus anak]|uniref:uncharacterized protein isoform X2 n=1 Tax=Trachinotus anak TaxID=443729 RepID=UPI0039F259E8
MKVATMTTKKQIAETLKILSPEELDKFKSLIELEKGFPHSSRSRLKVANVQDVVELVVQTYRQDSVEVTKKVLKKMNRTDLVQGWSDISAGTKDKRPEDDQRPALIQKVETTVSVIELLLETLADLSIKKLREFKQILRIQIHRYRPHSDIPWSLFRMADLQDTVFLMVQTFGQQSVEKTKKVLKKMTRTELVRRLSDSSSGPTKKHSVDEHLSALIHKVATMVAVKELILETLTVLNYGDLEKFKWFLQLTCFQKDFPYISWSRLGRANRADLLVEVMVETCGQQSVEVTNENLKRMNRTDLVQRLSETSSGLKATGSSAEGSGVNTTEGEKDERCSALIQKEEAMMSVIELLLEKLADLSIGELRGFNQVLLSQIRFDRHNSDIPWNLLMMVDLQDTVLLMVQTYSQESVEKTKKVLKEMNRTDLVQRLTDSSSGPKKKLSVDERYSALIQKVATIAAVEQLLLENLNDLSDEELQKFKKFLRLIDSPWDASVSSQPLSDRVADIVAMMVETYGHQSMEVTKKIFLKMNKTNLVQSLSETSRPKEKQWGDEHRAALFERVAAKDAVKHVVLETLNDLNLKEFSKFKWFLQFTYFQRGLPQIPRSQLVKADSAAMAELIVEKFGQQSVEVIREVFTDINKTDLVQTLLEISVQVRVKHLTALLQKDLTITSVQEKLLETLEDLSHEEFKIFKWFLQQTETMSGLPGIPKSRMEMAQRVDVLDLMVQAYGEESVEVTREVLMKINRIDLEQRLSEISSGPRVKQVTSPLQKDLTITSVQEKLLETLDDLTCREFEEFKWLLQHKGIPRSRLEMADRVDTVDLMVQAYGEQSVEVTREVLMEMNRIDLEQRLSEISSGPKVKQVTSPLQKDLTMTSVQEKLLETLEDLSYEEFKKFKWFLQQTETMSGLPGIPKYQLEMAQRVDVLDLIVQTYGEQSVEVTREVFMKINRIDLEQRLSEISSGPRVKQVTSPLQKDLTMRSVQEKLLETLEELTYGELEEFKWLLQHKGIPRSRLEMADRVDIVDLMVQAYGEQSVEVTREVLMEINRIDLEQRLSEISSGPKVKQVTSPLQKDLTMRSVQEKLLETLKELTYRELEEFKWLLQHKGIPRSRLEMADRVDIVDLMVQAYGEQSVEVTREVLMEMNRIDLEQRLSEISSGPKVKHVTSPLQKDLTMTSVQEKLLETLEDLTYGELEEFRWLLQHKGIPRSRLEMADRVDIVDLMVQAYGEQSVEVTREVLMEVNRIDLEQRLSEISSGPKGPSRSSALEGCRSTMESSDWTKLEPEVNSTDVDEAPTYSLQSEAGHFECSVSALRWVCKEKVSLKYQFFSWEGHMERMESRQYMAAGPLMNITVIAGKLDEVYLPHWICIDDNPTILDKFAVLHIDDCGDVVEKVSEVTPSHVKLSEPVFSPRAVLVKAGFPVKTRSYVLIYYKPNIPSLKLHVYVIPKDPALQQTVDKMEISYQYEKIRKPHPDRSLKMKQGFILTADIDTAEICPKELTLRHESDPNFYEVFIENPDRDFNLKLSQSSTNEQVWSHKIQKDDYQNSGPSEAAGPSTGATGENTMAEGEYTEEHFVVKHQLALIDRVKNVAPILDELFVKKVIGREIYETIRKLCNPFDKIREIYPSLEASDKCKDIFYEILTRHEKHLIEDLHNKK